jgi:hypothetical protein
VPSFDSFVRFGVETCNSIKSVVPPGIEDLHRARRHQVPLFVRRNLPSHALTCCPQHPRAYLGSCIGTGEGLDQPVRDARRGAGLLIFLSGHHDYGQSMLVIAGLPTDRAAHVHAVDTRGVVLKYHQRQTLSRSESSRLIHVREKFNVNALGSNDLQKGCRHLCIRDTKKHGPLGQRRLDRHLRLKLSNATRGTFCGGRCYLYSLPLESGKNV